MRERELKPTERNTNRPAMASLPMRERELKPRIGILHIVLRGRSPCGSASEKRDFFVLALFAIAARLLV